MTTRYCDPRAAGPGSGTQNDPFPTLAAAVALTAANDTILLASGQRFRETLSLLGTDGVTVGIYGGTQRATIDAEGVRDYCVQMGNASNFTFADIDLLRPLRNGGYVYNDQAGVTESNIVVRRSVCYEAGPALGSPATEADIEKGTGWIFRTGPTTGTAVLDGVLLEDVGGIRCGKHGVDIRWRVLNVTMIRPVGHYCGATGPGHGITFHPVASTVTSGWTLVSGNVYSRAFVSSNDNPQRVVNNTTPAILVQNTGTPTTPGSGEWGKSGTTLYINLGGTDPNTQSVTVKRHAHGPFTIYDPRGEGNYTYGGLEGYGLGFDDLTGPATVYGGLLQRNQGRGVFAFRGESITLRGTISQLNDGGGFGFDRVSGSVVEHCWAARNANRGFVWLNDAKNTTFRNSIATHNGLSHADAALNGTGMFMVAAGAATLTQASLRVYGNGGTSQTASVTATDEDPLARDLFDAQAGLRDDSPCWRAGTLIAVGTLDRDLLPYAVPADIGPWARRQPSGAA